MTNNIDVEAAPTNISIHPRKQNSLVAFASAYPEPAHILALIVTAILGTTYLHYVLYVQSSAEPPEEPSMRFYLFICACGLALVAHVPIAGLYWGIYGRLESPRTRSFWWVKRAGIVYWTLLVPLGVVKFILN